MLQRTIVCNVNWAWIQRGPVHEPQPRLMPEGAACSQTIHFHLFPLPIIFLSAPSPANSRIDRGSDFVTKGIQTAEFFGGTSTTSSHKRTGTTAVALAAVRAIFVLQQVMASWILHPPRKKHTYPDSKSVDRGLLPQVIHSAANRWRDLVVCKLVHEGYL